MKKFLNKIFSFFLITTIIGLCILFAINIVSANRTDFIMDTKNGKVVFGHSHPECAFNDAYIDDFSNFATSGEAYFYTYNKAEEVIKQNENIKTVFVEFSNDQVNGFTDKWIWTDKYLSKRYDEYLPFLNLKEHTLLLYKNPKGFLKYLVYGSKKNVKKIANNRMHFSNEVGGYRDLRINKPDSIRLKNLANNNEKELNINLSKINILYLKKLVDFCKTKGLNVYLVRSPIHKSSIEMQYETIFKKVLKEQFHDVVFLDFISFPLEDIDFYDLGHLSSSGSKKFSIFFNDLLSNGLLEEENKQKLINQKIKLLANKTIN